MQTKQTPTEGNHSANQKTEVALDDATCSRSSSVIDGVWQFSVGDGVFWEDPYEGQCSGGGVVTKIHPDGVIQRDTLISVKMLHGGDLACPAHELELYELKTADSPAGRILDRPKDTTLLEAIWARQDTETVYWMREWLNRCESRDISIQRVVNGGLEHTIIYNMEFNGAILITTNMEANSVEESHKDVMLEECVIEKLASLFNLANDERMHHYQRGRTSITGLVL